MAWLPGANALVVTYDSPPSGDAFVRLSWSSEDFAREPIPPVALARDEAPPSEGNVFASRPQGNETHGRWAAL